VPRRFWEMTSQQKKVMAPPPMTPAPAKVAPGGEVQIPGHGQVQSVEGPPAPREASVIATPPVGGPQTPVPVKTESSTTA
jgi:hypothetical protein